MSSSTPSMKQLQFLITGYIRATMKSINQILPIELIKIVDNYFNILFDHIELEPVQEIIEWMQQLTEKDKTQMVQTDVNDLHIEIPQYFKKPNILSSMINKLNIYQYYINSILDRNVPYFGTINTIQKQIAFWRSKSSAIKHIKSQLKTAETCTTIFVLYKNNYSKTALSFSDDSKLTQVLQVIALDIELFETFPDHKIKESKSVSDIIIAINEMFASYWDPNRRMIRNAITFKQINSFIQIAANDTALKLKEILGTNIMAMDYTLFVNKTSNTEKIFYKFQNEYTKIRSLYSARRSFLCNHRRVRDYEYDKETQSGLYILQKIEKRIRSMKKIRKQHNEFKKAIYATLSMF